VVIILKGGTVKTMCSRSFFICIGLSACLCLEAAPAWAGSVWFHATRRALAQKIISRGINPARFKATARFGRGLYLARKPSTALAETGKRNAVIRMRGRKGMSKRGLDLRNPTKENLRPLVGKKYDLRGKVKQGVIGPRLGHVLGKKSASQGKSIQYRSAKDGGANLFVPKALVTQKPRLVRPEKIYCQGR